MIRKSLVTKFIAAFLVMIVIPTMIIGYLMFRKYSEESVESASANISETLEQSAESVDLQMINMSMVLATLSQDNEIIELLNKWNRSESKSERFELSKKLDDRFYSISNYFSGVNTVVVYFDDGGEYYFGNPPLIVGEQARERQWYIDTLNNGYKVNIIESLSSISDGNHRKYYLSFAINPEPISYENNIEVIYISSHSNALEVLLSSTTVGTRMLVDENKGVIYPRDIVPESNVYINSFNSVRKEIDTIDQYSVHITRDKEILVNKELIRKAGWYVLNIADYDEVTQGVRAITRSALIVGLIAVILFVIFSVIFFGNIVTPIRRLMYEMKKVEKGDFDTVLEVKQRDEIYQLVFSFNTMTAEIKRLMKERDLKEREKIRAEINALQSEINPHFIANTLSSIRFMAMIAKVDSIKDMTEAFINMVSSVFNRGSRMTTVKKEIELLKSYVYIMNVKHGNKFEVTFEVGEEEEELYLLKMLVQPILENAIIHGFTDNENKGHISIRFRHVDKKLSCIVTDDGCGIDPDRLEKILREDKAKGKGFTSLGMFNVDQRIKLNYGDEFGLNIRSVLGEMTRVEVKLPILTEDVFSMDEL